jgi:hypothetical protein
MSLSDCVNENDDLIEDWFIFLRVIRMKKVPQFDAKMHDNMSTPTIRLLYKSESSVTGGKIL